MDYPRYTYRLQIWHIIKGWWSLRRKRKGKVVHNERKQIHR